MIGAPAAGGMFAFPDAPALIHDAIMTQLAGFAGGRLGTTILAPKNLQQFCDVMIEASRIEEDAGLAVIPPANLPLAQLYLFQDNRRNTTGAPVTVKHAAGATATFA